MSLLLFTIERMSGLQLSRPRLLVQHKDLGIERDLNKRPDYSLATQFSMSGLWLYFSNYCVLFLSYLERNFSFVTVDDPVAANWTIFCFNFGSDFHQTSVLADTAMVDSIHQ